MQPTRASLWLRHAPSDRRGGSCRRGHRLCSSLAPSRARPPLRRSRRRLAEVKGTSGPRDAGRVPLAGAAGAWVPRPPAAEEHQMTKQKSQGPRPRPHGQDLRELHHRPPPAPGQGRLRGRTRRPARRAGRRPGARRPYSDEVVRANTGHTWDEWFALLDVGRRRASPPRDRPLGRGRARGGRLVGPGRHRRLRAGARPPGPRAAARRAVRGERLQDGGGAGRPPLRGVRRARPARALAPGRHLRGAPRSPASRSGPTGRTARPAW